MIRINLLTTREVDEASSQRRELILVFGGIAAVLVLCASAFFAQQNTLGALDSRTQLTEKELTVIRKQNEAIDKLEQQKRELEGRVRVVELLTSTERRSASVHILDDLSSSTPPYLWLTEFTENNGTARISGRSVDNQTIAAFANDLNKSPYFKTVEIRETQQEDLQSPASRAAARRASNAPPQPQIPVQRFLIDATINYNPGAVLDEPASESSAGNPVVQDAEKKSSGE